MRPRQPRRNATVAAILALATAFVLSALAPAQAPERRMRIFDCGFLTERVRDQSGPDVTRFRFGPELEDEPGPLEVSDEAWSALDPDQLVDLIRGNIRPDTWEHKLNTIHFRNGLLIAMQTPEVLDEVAELLRGLRRRTRKRLHLVGRVLSVRMDHFAAGHAGAGRSGAGAVVSPAEVRRLLDVPKGDDRLRVLDTLSLPARSNQVVHAGSVRSTRFIRDLEVTRGEDRFECEPVVDEFLTGSVLTFRAWPVGDSMVVVDAHVARAELVGEMETQETGIGRVDIPTRAVQSSSTTLLVPRGQAALLAVSDAVETDRVIVFLVEPQILGADESGDRVAAAKAPTRSVRVHDIRFLVSAYPDRPCRYLRSSSPGTDIDLNPREEEGGAMFGCPAEDAGIPYNPEDLIELIRETIDEDSWENTRNRIDLSNGMLVVVQTPEVHAEIERLLGDLEARRGVLITTQGWALAVPSDRVAELFPDPATLGRALDAETLARVHRAVADGRVEVLRHARVTSFNRQRTHAASVIERPVIRGLDPVVGKRVATLKPIMGVLRTGFVLDVTPNLVGDGKHLSLDLVARYCTAEAPRAVAHRKDDAHVMHSYRTEAANLQATVFLPEGGAMAFLRGAVPARPDQRLVYLVAAESTVITGRK